MLHVKMRSTFGHANLCRNISSCKIKHISKPAQSLVWSHRSPNRHMASPFSCRRVLLSESRLFPFKTCFVLLVCPICRILTLLIQLIKRLFRQSAAIKPQHDLIHHIPILHTHILHGLQIRNFEKITFQSW